MSINSRSKGNKNERYAALLATTWTKKKFSRTPSSGGLQWKTAFTKGDIVCAKEGHFFPFCVEVKAHREIDFSQLMIPGLKNVKLFEFWEQCTRDATRAKKVPLLLARYDHLPKMFFFTILPFDFFMLIKSFYPGVKYLYFVDFKRPSFVVLSSIDFFKAPYKPIRKIAKTYLKNGKEKIKN